MGHNPSTTKPPSCTLRLCPGSQSFYKYITILYFTSLPGVTILLQVHHHTVRYVSTRGHNSSTSTSPYCIYVSGRVKIPLQVHHHPVLYVFAWGHNPSTSTSPYCTLRLWPGSQSFYMFITIMYLRLCPGSQTLYKYITILYFTSLPGVTIPLQVHHHPVLNVSAPAHNPSTRTSPYCTLRLCPGSQSFYKYITILYFTSLPGATILLQVYYHTLFYVSAREVTILLQVNHHPLLMSLPGVTIFL